MSRSARSDAFDIDGTVAPVTVLRLKTADVARIEKELRARLAAVRQKFPFTPVVVDVAGLAGSALELPLHDLAERLRACQLVPVGAAGLPPSAVWNAAAAGMAVVELGAAPAAAPPVQPAPSAAPTPKQAAPTPPEPAAQPAVSTVTVRQPVRSGQVIYAERADLVVLAAVNAGAQVVADGHIHVYGPLRGRAVAGKQGMADARIFCQSLEAELIAIGDHQLVADDIPAEHRGRRAQIFAEGGHLRIQPL